MRVRKREIAKAGIFGSKDDPRIVTERDLQEIAETFAEIKKAPVALGHYPRAEDPRLGNVVSVACDEAAKSLSAEIEEDDALADAVDAGYYPDVSVRVKQRAADGKMYLVHLAYLGQEAPAVKDLASSVKESLGIAAAEASGARVFPSPSEKQLYLSETPPDKTFLTSNKEEPPGTGSGPQPSPGERSGAAGTGGNSAGSASPPHQTKEVCMTEEEARKLREENERLKAESRAKDLALSEAAGRQREAERERLKAAMDGKVPKGLQAKVLELSGTFDEGKSIELSDESAPGGKRKTTGMELLLEIVSALPRPVEPGALSLSDSPPRAEASGKPDAAGRRKMLAAV
ncbi:MAG: hypothetical protein LBS37_06700 [Treponema sp.]|jgi:hypothetical protein|nr:hypothetical protein [Treponema sp.]